MADLYLLNTQDWQPHIETMQQILSETERNEIARFRREDDQLRSSVSRAAVRWILSQQTGQHPTELQIQRNNYGKPYLPEHRVWFNASHSGQIVAVAMSRQGPVGVDVEWIRGHKCGMDVARRFFSVEECGRLQCVTPEQFAAVFTRIWTGKEALVKASGCGIGHGLEHAVLDEHWNPVHGDYKLSWCEPIEGYQCAVATLPGEELTSRLWLQSYQWPSEWPK